MSSVTVTWDEDGIRNLFTSQAMSDALYKAGMDVADEATPLLNKQMQESASRRSKNGSGSVCPLRKGYGCKTKRLKDTYVAIVHPRSRAAYAIEAKHHILYNFK